VRKIIVAPAASAMLAATKRPWVWKIGSAWISRSASVKRQASRSATQFEARLPWVSTAPLDRPVVPEASS